MNVSTMPESLGQEFDPCV